jgi:hypothetical protein
MKIADIRELLKNKKVVEEINRHLWIESQKAGYSIGIERATDEWLRLYSEGWMKYHMPEKNKAIQAKNKKKRKKAKKSVKAKKKTVKAKKVNTVKKKASKESAKKANARK